MLDEAVPGALKLVPEPVYGKQEQHEPDENERQCDRIRESGLGGPGRSGCAAKRIGASEIDPRARALESAAVSPEPEPVADGQNQQENENGRKKKLKDPEHGHRVGDPWGENCRRRVGGRDSVQASV